MKEIFLPQNIFREENFLQLENLEIWRFLTFWDFGEGETWKSLQLWPASRHNRQIRRSIVTSCTIAKIIVIPSIIEE